MYFELFANFKHTLRLEAKESYYMIFVLFIAMISMHICKNFSKI